ncbi:hypothetical protein BT96DRAFT_50941 [Gymnopus androsaceus JB14]|uniref:Uncharacterized protein n=1 Tax=Gymnopus androsaceus JB14 TaxID=1447944 RepID=A0A6A4HLH1_9AGAR|nr:hypothetical protein BT96DRAFT_50941 [Gymnopus androsaceus JB14]
MKRGFLSGKLLVPEPTPQPNVSLAAEKVPSVTVSSTASTPVSDSSSATPPNLRKGFLVGKRLEKNVVSRDPKPSTSELQSKSAYPDSLSNPPGYTLFFTENPYTNPALAMMRACGNASPLPSSCRRATKYMSLLYANEGGNSFPRIFSFADVHLPVSFSSIPNHIGSCQYGPRHVRCTRYRGRRNYNL